jgi:hypothetical protein
VFEDESEPNRQPLSYHAASSIASSSGCVSSIGFAFMLLALAVLLAMSGIDCFGMFSDESAGTFNLLLRSISQANPSVASA